MPNSRACLAHAETQHGDADRVVLAGDLTHHERRTSFKRLRAVPGPSLLAPRSTNHPNAPDLIGRGAIAHGPLAPSYNVVLIDDENTVVHTIDFLLEPDLEWITIQDNGWIDETPAAE